MKKVIWLGLGMMLIFSGCSLPWANTPATTDRTDSGVMTEDKAREIAREVAGFEGGDLANETGFYNENSKTWWFDADLPNTPDGCNPASVVYEDTGVGEINWRCTGLIEPDTADELLTEADMNTIIVGLFAEKYPENSGDISVNINNQTSDHARGSVSFEEGMAGGNWLAAKVDGQWQLVFDGNGVIPCSLKTDYGFPDEMLTDCAE